MGNQQSHQIQYLAPNIRQIELDTLQKYTGCSPELTNVLNTQLAIILQEANIKFTESPLTLLSNPLTSQNTRNQVKSLLLDKVNHAELNKTLQTRFHQEPLMAALTCLYGNHWILDRQSFEATDYTRTFFTVTDNLSVGNWGSVYRGERTGMPFIIRAQNDASNGERSLHESFVALRFLNSLRGVCPNFSVILGSFVCGDPDSITGKICTGPNPIQYTIYEDIPGSNIYDFTKVLRSTGVNAVINRQIDPKPIVENVISALFQVMLALRYAQKQCRFGHRDLHGGNVVMRPLGREVWIPYDSAGFDADPYLKTSPIGHRKIFYIRSSYIATMIDYETSEVFIPISVSGVNKTTVMPQLISFGITTGNTTEQSFSDPTFTALKDVQKFIYSLITAFAYSTAVPQIIHNCLVSTLIDLLWPEYSNGSYDSKIQVIQKAYADGDGGIKPQNIEGIRQGIIHPHRFLPVFLKNLPPSYRDKLYVEEEITAENQTLIEKELTETTGLSILRSEKSGSAMQELQAILQNDQEAETLLEIARRVNEEVRSARYFANSHIGVSHRKDLEKKLLEDERQISEIEKGRLLREHQILRQRISEMIVRIKLPNPLTFHQEYSSSATDGVIEYRRIITELFELYRMGRDLIAINNTFGYFKATSGLLSRKETIETLNSIATFFNAVVFPWKDLIFKLSSNGYFGAVNLQIVNAVLLRFPTNLTFEGI